jgi:hypothetical protein
MGSLVLQPKVGWVPEFENYFRTLNLANSRNPWFSEFWSSVFKCSDENCDDTQNLSKYPIDQVNNVKFVFFTSILYVMVIFITQIYAF